MKFMMRTQNMFCLFVATLLYYQQAQAFADQQRFDEALREYQKVLQLDADFADSDENHIDDIKQILK